MRAALVAAWLELATVRAVRVVLPVPRVRLLVIERRPPKRAPAPKRKRPAWLSRHPLVH